MTGATKRVLVLAAAGEAATGVALLLVPSLVGQLLLGAELTGVAVTVARVAGIALIALGLACWPGTPLLGMLLYSAAVTLYLAYVGFAGGLAGAVAEVLEYVPASFKVIRHVRPKLACAGCQKIVQEPAPSRPIARGIAGPGLLAHILVAKYCDHLPLYRQSQILTPARG